MSKQQKNMNPNIKWDGKEFFVTLPVPKELPKRDAVVIEAKWEPVYTYVIRIREVGTSEWSLGFETPLTGGSYVDLKPDTEYDIQIRAKNSTGEGEPAYVKTRTSPKGQMSNIIPFPPKK